MPETIDDLKKVITDLQKQLGDQQASVSNSKIAALDQQVKDGQIALDAMRTLKDQAEEKAKGFESKVKEKDEELEKLKKTQSDELRAKIIAQYGDSVVIMGKPIKDACLNNMQVFMTAIQIHKDQELKNKGTPKPPEEDHNKKITGNDSAQSGTKKALSTVSADDLKELTKAK
jgi:chromosome segregation ATPase